MNQIRVRRFGTTDLQTSEFGLGCARIGGIFKHDPSEFERLLSAAYDAGITFFDTADIYSQGESEKLLGRVFRRQRDRVIIASKAGYVLPSRRRVIAKLKPFVRPIVRLIGIKRQHLPGAVGGALTQNFSPDHLCTAVEGSLRRLATDRLDLFHLHSPPAAVVELGRWVDALDTLKREGKIRHYGVSCDGVDAAAAALQYKGVSSLQLPINLLERDAIAMASQAHRQGVGVVARECLANGLLVKDVRELDISRYVRSESEGVSKIARIAEFRKDADARGCTLPQLAVQFVHDLEGVTVTLLGVSRQQQLEELLLAGLGVTSRP